MDLYLERLQQAIASATNGMTSDELTRHPEGHPEGTWSVAEVLEHLYLTYTGTTKAFERCLKAGKPLASPITLKQRVGITLVTELGYFPKGRKAPERATPKGMPADKLMADIGPQIAAMDKLIAECEASTARARKYWTTPSWARSPPANGGSFTGCTDGTT